LDAELRPRAERLVMPGETMQGYVVVTEQKTFSGHQALLVVTDQRLVLQPFDRHWGPKGAPTSVGPGELAWAKGARWWAGATVTSIVAESTTREFSFETTAGEKHKLRMMSGSGLLGGAGGGEVQQQGIAALVGWLQANEPT
jgi:hypothetical protein